MTDTLLDMLDVRVDLVGEPQGCIYRGSPLADHHSTIEARMLYFTGVSNELTKAVKRPDLGLLGTPAGSTWKQKTEYPAGWAADNGCFVDVAKPGSFKPATWLAWLELAGPADCAWATLPDVVGDPVATWVRSEPYIERVRGLGFPIATVMQNGLESQAGIWSEMLDVSDCVFVGGLPECKPCDYIRPAIEKKRKHCPHCLSRLTEWKLDAAARLLVFQAQALDKLVHVGRVNSRKRMVYSAFTLNADSADGTYLNFGVPADREKNTRTVFSWLDEVNA